MIELIRAAKYYPTEHGRHYVFRDVSLKLPLNVNVGVIGPNGSGKSTLLRLLAGGDVPSEGEIIRTGRISWPLGLTPGLQPTLTAAENARFAGRIYGMAPGEIRMAIERIEEIANIGKFFELPVKTYSAGMRQRVSFAISMAMDFDYYLFDEISAGGDREFKARAAAMIRERLRTSNFIMVSHDLREVAALCQSAILLGDGQLLFFKDAREAIRAYGELYPVQKARVSAKAQFKAPPPGTARPAPRPPNPARQENLAAAIALARKMARSEERRARELRREIAALMAAKPGARPGPRVHELRKQAAEASEQARQHTLHARNLQRIFTISTRIAPPPPAPATAAARMREPRKT
jgi:capsular polysaccharide transport system ATP-binding protein